MNLVFWLGGLLVLLLASEGTSAQDDHPEERLRNDLFANYNKVRRPAENVTDTVTVNVGFMLTSLVHMDFVERSIHASFWLKLSWYDTRLQWNPEGYGGMLVLPVPSADIWQPDLTLYNSIETIQEIVDVHALVYNSGYVYVIPSLKVKASCDLDIADYPYDTQKCRFKWGSWTHDKAHIDLTPGISGVDLDEYWPNPWWELVNTNVTKNAIQYPCCTETYVDVTVELTLRRQVTHGRIAPAVVAAWLILVVFLIGPSSSGERIVFAGFVFVSLVVLSAELSASVPGASTTRLGRFLLAGMLITAIIATVNGVLFRMSSMGKVGGEVKTYTVIASPRFFIIVDAVALVVTTALLAIVTAALFA